MSTTGTPSKKPARLRLKEFLTENELLEAHRFHRAGGTADVAGVTRLNENDAGRGRLFGAVHSPSSAGHLLEGWNALRYLMEALLIARVDRHLGPGVRGHVVEGADLD